MFVKPQIIIRHNRSFVSSNIPNWWRRKKNPPHKSNYSIVDGTLLYCYWYTITLHPFFFNHIWLSTVNDCKREGQWMSGGKTHNQQDCGDSFSSKTIIIRSFNKRKENHECRNVFRFFFPIIFHRFFKTIYFISSFCKNVTLFWTELGVNLLNRILV